MVCTDKGNETYSNGIVCTVEKEVTGSTACFNAYVAGTKPIATKGCARTQGTSRGVHQSLKASAAHDLSDSLAPVIVRDLRIRVRLRGSPHIEEIWLQTFENQFVCG